MTKLRSLILLFCTMMFVSSCCPPPITYPTSPNIIAKRQDLQSQLLALLPVEEQKLPAAQEEAQWLADTSYKAAAAISRINDSCYIGWFGNMLVNMNLQDRGLCWHYQHDMYRELRRKQLHYFELGTCVRSQGAASEHNCNTIMARGQKWPHAIMLDAWIGNGRLKTTPAWELNQKRWTDSEHITKTLRNVYPEEHPFPIEAWFRIKTPDGLYSPFWTGEARSSSQYRRMFENIEEGKEEHPDSPITY